MVRVGIVYALCTVDLATGSTCGSIAIALAFALSVARRYVLAGSVTVADDSEMRRPQWLRRARTGKRRAEDIQCINPQQATTSALSAPCASGHGNLPTCDTRGAHASSLGGVLVLRICLLAPAALFWPVGGGRGCCLGSIGGGSSWSRHGKDSIRGVLSGVGLFGVCRFSGSGDGRLHEDGTHALALCDTRNFSAFSPENWRCTTLWGACERERERELGQV